MKLKAFTSLKSLKRFYYTQRAIRRIASYKGLPKVNHKSYFSKKTYLGFNCNFNGMRIGDGGKVVIGDNFHSGKGCSIITRNHNIHGNALPYDNTYIIKDVKIGDNVWFGNRVMVLAGVTIGEGAVIQAGSVVVNDIPPLTIAGGHPAVVFSQRNKEHYFELKRLGKFN